MSENGIFYELPQGLDSCIASLLNTELAYVKSNLLASEKMGMPCDNKKADVLFINPPFHYNGKYDSTFLLEGFKRLNCNGQGVCIVSGGLLSRCTSNDILVRQKLLTEMDLHAIILLPENTFPGAKAFSAVLYFSNRTPSKDDIITIDLRDRQLSREILKNTASAIMNQDDKNIGIITQMIDRDSVKAPEYILNPDIYKAFTQEDKGRIMLFGSDMADYILYDMDKCFAKEFPNAVQRFNGETNERPKGKKCGRELFVLKNGKDLPKDHKNRTGPYPLYQGSGICGTTDICNVEEQLPTLIINRVGSCCGRIYYTKRPCFVQGNSMFIAQYSQKLHPIFLFFLFRAANFNRWKNGTTIPSIRQNIIYNTWFAVPSLRAQKEFVDIAAPKMKQVLDIWNEMTYIKQEVLF